MSPKTNSTSGKKKGGVSRLFSRKKQEGSPPQQNAPAPSPPIAPVAADTVVAKIPPKKPTEKRSISKELPKTSWFCRSAHFRKLCDTAFEAVDTDGSGNVDHKELYSGLLLIHLKFGCYAGPAACRPLSRERCEKIFEQFDEDDSGYLDKEEFRQVMMVLFSNVFFRVVVQWCMTLLIVPLVARWILDGILWLVTYILGTIANLDEHSDVANSIELTLEGTLEGATNWCYDKTPQSILKVTDKISELVALVPESVWNAVPLAIISTILGIVVVPYVIFQIDDYFQRVAERSAKKKKKKPETS